MSSCISKIRASGGQTTVEAACIIPVLLVLILLLIQPGILLYNRMVMVAAATEGCRLLTTKTDVMGSSQEKCEGFILRRLGSIPPHDLFHMHSRGCSWEIELVGDEFSSEVMVTIRNKARLLPLFDFTGTLLGLCDSEGVYIQEVSATLPTQPQWVFESDEGFNPQDRIGDWS